MSTYEISKSSLLSLKAEILRKQEELTKIKQINELKLGNIKKTSLFHKPRTEENKKPDGVEENQDENLLKKSRVALEAKAKLYDKLVEESAKYSDVQTEERPRYLVQFDKKVNIDKSNRNLPANDNRDSEVLEDTFEEEYDGANNPDDEWVEYKDCLGRTRMCMKKDLPHLKLDDEKLKKEVESRLRLSGEGQDKETELDKSKDDDAKPDENDELTITIDKRRELLRQQWEKEEDKLRDKADIHYQDLLFDEARTHGVSYYAFSKDEEERAKQQEALRKLRQETEEQQKKSHDLKMLREKQMAARLKTARNRKRARMGLPPEEDEPVPETQQPEKPPENEESEKVSEPSSEELAREEARRRHVRPWDIGKEGVKEFYVYTQEEWVEKKRDDRPAEFAPPSTYGREFTSNVSYNRFREPQNQSLYDTTLKTDAQPSMNRNPHKLRKLNLYKYNEYEPIEQPELREPVPITDECETTQHNVFDSERNNSSVSRGKGVEIAPPSTYEYYGPSDAKRKKPLENKNLDLEESINVGLQFLRKEFEKKKSTRQSEEMFLT